MGFVLELVGPVGAGRDADNDLVLADRQVSRRHLRFETGPAGVDVRDLASTHGTLINGVRAEAKRLADGDVVQVGGVVIVFRTGAPPTPRPGDSVWRTASELVEPAARASSASARRLRLLFDVGRLLGALDDSPTALERLLDLTVEVLDCSRAVIAIGRRIARSRGGGEVAIDPAILAQVVARREAVLVRDPTVRSAMAAPLDAGSRVLGVLYVDDRERSAAFVADDLEFLAALARLAAAALVQAEAQRRAQGVAEVMAGAPPPLIGDSEPMQKLRAQIARCATADATIVIHGETGTGKELVAAHLHAASRRADRPFIAVNCAAIPESLIETELFGHAKGAFTGATATRRGLFVSADGGTLFLDEVGELSPAAQAKLLRVLETGELQPVGSDETIEVDVRTIAASHRDLLREVAAGRFREDLYYRLDVLALDVPPLRVRGDDVLKLAEHFRADAAARLGRPVGSITPAARAALRAYGWPGNVRQLHNELERAVLLAEGNAVDAGDLRLRGTPEAPAATLAEDHARLDQASWELVQRAVAQGGTAAGAARLLHISPAELDALLARDPAAMVLVEREASAGAWPPIEAAERQLIEAALRDHDGNVRDAGRALGVSRATMYRKIEKYGLK